MRIKCVSNKIEMSNNIENIIQLTKEVEHEDVIDSTTALNPLYCIMNFLGERHNPNKAQWKKQLHSILLIILLLTSGTFIVVLRSSSFYLHAPIIASTIEVFSEINLLILVAWQLISSASSSPITDNKIKSNFGVIDSLLGIDTPDLYKRGKTTVIKLMAWHIFIFVLVVAVENYSKFSTKFLLLYCVEYFLYFMKCFLTLYFTSHLYFLKNQFFILNIQLEVGFNPAKDNACITNINGNTRVIDVSCVENYLFSCNELRKQSEDALKRKKGVDINDLAEVYVHCCNQADLINFKCSIQNLLEINYGILALIRNFVYAIMYVVNSTPEERNIANILSNVSYSLYDLVNLFVILSSCEFVKSEVKKTAIHLDNILHNYCSVISEERRNVEAWIELTMRRYPQFTVCGSLELDYGLFFSLLGTVMTYIVIVTQFE